MSLASAAGVLLKSQTPLQQLLEDINFQRTKEMRQLLKDESGFVVLQGTTYWTDLFVRHFLFQTEPVHSIDSDDLLFFVRKKHVKTSSRHMPKYETEVDVFRKDSRKLPIGDPDVDWEETVYLNMVIHQFDYTLTLAICTRTSPKELQVLRRHSQRVYASPSRRKMDTKGEGEEITYPHICFMVDNFDEVFSDILVRDGEMVCVELVASDKDGAVQGVIFLGSIRYDALKKVYDARQSSLSSKVAQRMSFGLFSSGASVQTRCEFVRMKGPQGKGHAEMAVTKPKGSGVETPTSEPGFCATDMWDDWEEENDDYCTYRHRRRLSDPSANLNNFSRYGWCTKSAQDSSGACGGVGGVGITGSKARSENEGLDSLANEVSEIEAGDVRDDLRPAFSASEAKLRNNPNCEAHTITNTGNTFTTTADLQPLSVQESPIQATSSAVEATAISPISNTSTTGCNNCFGGKRCKRWVSAATGAYKNAPQMSEVYCPTCDDRANETPACLNKMPDKSTKPKTKSILCVESELIVGKRAGSLRLTEKKSSVIRSLSLSAVDKRMRKHEHMPTIVNSNNKREKLIKAKDKEPKETRNDKETKSKPKPTNLFAKVSPKRIRAKAIEKTKDSSQTPAVVASKNDAAVVVVFKNNNNNPTSTSEKSFSDDQIKLEDYEIADDATSLNGEITAIVSSETKMVKCDTKLMINVRGREELPVVGAELATSATPPICGVVKNPFHFEKCVRVPVKSESHPLQELNDFSLVDAKFHHHNDNDDNKLKAVEESTNSSSGCTDANVQMKICSDCNGNCNNQSNAAHTTYNNILSPSPSPSSPEQQIEKNNTGDDDDGNDNGEAKLPRMKRTTALHAFYNRALNLVPKRRTPDGTNIYYWCDLPKKSLKELDDGAYNPLWASRGFTQTFHFWKENRRQQSTPLNAFLTYVTLPWWSIAKDLLDHRETPILTF